MGKGKNSRSFLFKDNELEFVLFDTTTLVPHLFVDNLHRNKVYLDSTFLNRAMKCFTKKRETVKSS